MNRIDPAVVALRCISMGAAVGAVVAVLFLSGPSGRAMLKIAGIVMVGSSVVADRYGKARRSTNEGAGHGDQGVQPSPPWWDGVISIMVIVASIALGFLLYVAPENFPFRKIIVVAACLVVLLGLIERLLLKHATHNLGRAKDDE